MHLSVCPGCASWSAYSIKLPYWSIKFSKGLHCTIWFTHSCVQPIHSASTARLVVPPFKLLTICSLTFKVAAAQTCNCLHEDVTLSTKSHYRRTKLWQQASYLSDQLQLCAPVRQLPSSDRKNRLYLNSHRMTIASRLSAMLRLSSGIVCHTI